MAQRYSIYQVDTFTNQRFKGNPAAVVPLKSWLTESQMQAIAAENNLAETAFYVGDNGQYDIRWFTPTTEVDLCGHATLASAHVIRHIQQDTAHTLHFSCQAGPLAVRAISDEWLELDFPNRTPEPMALNTKVEDALGVKAKTMALARDLIVELADEQAVLACQPDFSALKQFDFFSVVITAPSQQPDIDFVSRFFAPNQGIDEDPVTGSSFCSLAPFWQYQLNKSSLNALQVSPRGGHIKLQLKDDRVLIAGQSILYLQGEIFI